MMDESGSHGVAHQAAWIIYRRLESCFFLELNNTSFSVQIIVLFRVKVEEFQIRALVSATSPANIR